MAEPCRKYGVGNAELFVIDVLDERKKEEVDSERRKEDYLYTTGSLGDDSLTSSCH